MNEMDKLTVLDLILTKNLSWISAVDTKATLIFTIDSAMLAVLTTLLPPHKEELSFYVMALIVATGALLLLSVVFVAFGLFPMLAKKYESNVFFGAIAKDSEDGYVKKIIQLSAESLIKDFAKQCHRNAVIANAKYFKIRLAMIITFIALPIWLLSIYEMYALK